MTATEPLLRAEEIRTIFPTSRGRVFGVDGVSFHIRPGETLGVVGESGSGKSVLARSLMQLTPPTAERSGRVFLEGRDLTALRPADARKVWGCQVALVLQNPMTSLNPVMRIGRQIGEQLELHQGLDRAASRSRAIELLTQVGIPEASRRVDSYPQELSGGMRQRVSIAMAISCGPKLLLADEPTTALDVTIQRQILDLLSGLQRDEHMAMMLITHDLGIVAGRTDRVLVMYGGRVMESAPTARLLKDMRHPYTSALVAATPRLELPSHSRLAAIPGLPADVVEPKPGCRFAARCSRAQPPCLDTDPELVPTLDDPEHVYACHFPIGTSDGDEALERNLRVGRNAAGVPVTASSLATG